MTNILLKKMFKHHLKSFIFALIFKVRQVDNGGCILFCGHSGVQQGAVAACCICSEWTGTRRGVP